MSRLLNVLALLSLLLLAAAPASGVMVRGEKTAVPDFFGSAFESAFGDEWPATQYRTRGGVDCSYETALDVRDGPNLYAYVMQNPWTMWDPHGLAAGDDDEFANFTGFHPQAAARAEASVMAANQDIKAAARAAPHVVKEVGKSFIPGVGEVQDAMVIADPKSSWFEKTLSQASLTLSLLTDGTSPNAGSFIVGGKSAKTAVKEAEKIVENTLYNIDDGVRRSKVADITGKTEIIARVKIPGQPDELTTIPLDKLRSPKKELPMDKRFLDNNLKKAKDGSPPPPIEVVPVKTETPGYVPIKDVKLVPPRRDD